MSIEAMKRALEYLQENEGCIADVSSSQYVKEYYEFMDRFAGVIKQAEQQEPVAWYDSKSGWTEFHSFKPVRKPSAPDAEWLPLYTAPPKRDLTCVCGAVWEGETMVHAPHQRKPLTYPQIHELDWPDGVAFEEILLFVRAIEAAHGIGEKP